MFLHANETHKSAISCAPLSLELQEFLKRYIQFGFIFVSKLKCDHATRDIVVYL